MGLAVRDALEEICGIPALIKWPNDIVMGEKKVCGILTEMSAEMDCIHYIVIGTGINVHDTDFPEELTQTAASVWQQAGKHVCRAELAAECMRYFESYYKIFLETQDLSALADSYNAHLINLDREVSILDGKHDTVGTGRGINIRGELLVDMPEGVRTVSSGEVSVRGLYGYT